MLLGDAGDAQSSEDDNDDDDDENDDDDDENDEVTNEDEERPGGDLPSFCISISKSISNALISFSLLLCNLFLSAAAFLIFSPSGVPLPRS